MLIYVDDIIITGSSTSAIDKLINLFAVEFPVKRLGELSYFLGIEVSKCPDGIHLSQRKYINDLLESTRMINANQCQHLWHPLRFCLQLMAMTSLTQNYIVALLAVSNICPLPDMMSHLP